MMTVRSEQRRLRRICYNAMTADTGPFIPWNYTRKPATAMRKSDDMPSKPAMASPVRATTV